MKYLWPFVLQFFLLLLLIRKDRNDGERELFKNQKWMPSHVVAILLSVNLTAAFSFFLVRYWLGMEWVKIGPYVYHLLFIFGLVILFKYLIRQDIRAIGFKTNKKQVFVAVMIVTGWHIIQCVLLYIIKGPAGLNFEVLEDIGRLNEAWYYSLRIFHSVILASVIEEIIFRGILYSPYRKKYGCKVSIFLNILLFSAYHPIRGFGASLTHGALYAILYEKMESVVPSIAAHITTNLLVILTPIILKSVL